MQLKTITRNTLCFVLIFLQVAAFPSFTIAQEAQEAVTESTAETAPADDSVPASASSEPEAPAATPAAPSTPAAPKPATPAVPATPAKPATNTGVQQPTGADASTFTKNDDGTWSNEYYIWDPVTKQRTPKTSQAYTFNPVSRLWEMTEYLYSPAKGEYIPNVKSTAVNPYARQLSATGSGSSNLIAGAPGSFNISNTGANSNNTINGNGTTTADIDLLFNGSITNNIGSNAQSGNALVQGNTMAGDALSGDALAIAMLLNMLQSSWIGSSEIASFISTIDGNVYGDLLIDPSQLPYTAGSSDVDVNISNNSMIDNNVNLAAQSGSATVDANTTAGNATSGDAYAMASIINMINASISSGRSFLGMINITGNLNGDILLPPGMLEALISNTGYNSTNTIGGGTASTTDINNDTNRAINNNIDVTATSGDASVNANTTAGNATSGTANTSTNTMNLVGQNIKGKNGLLVFVNVLGHWYGMVVGPAPATATIDTTGANSTNTIGGTGGTQSLTVNAEENSLINNDITISTQSGDATVSRNTTAGNATSGNTESAVNLLNIIGGDIDVSDWFGVLFINVFGNWTGNFGSDTANGGFSQAVRTGGAGGGAANTAAASGNAAASGGGNPVGQVFGFFARSNNNNAQVNANQTASTNGQTTSNNSAVFGNTNTPATPGSAAPKAAAAINASQMNWWIIAGVLGIIATLAVLGREYVLTLREEQLTTSTK